MKIGNKKKASMRKAQLKVKVKMMMKKRKRKKRKIAPRGWTHERRD